MREMGGTNAPPKAVLDQGFEHTSGSLNASSEGHSQPHCPICLDLNSNLYKEIKPDHGHPRRFDIWISLRYHVCVLKSMYIAAKKGCRHCKIIYEGVMLFWHGSEDDSDNKAPEEQSHGWKEHGFDYGEYENQEGNKPTPKLTGVPRWIFLGLKEGKPLQVLRAGTQEDILSLWHIFLESRYATALEFYTDMGHTPINSAFGCSPDVPTRLELSHCIKLLNGWLQDCESKHNTCLSPAPHLPKRLVNVSETEPRLVETKDLPYSRYTTLSHCWGDPTEMIKTTKENIERRHAGIDWEELPQIFNDAITVTRSIDCKWIWIDSLCIIQDDQAEWEEESANMAAVYSNSFLNIATTFSPSSYGNCFSRRTITCGRSEGFRSRPIKSVHIGEHLNELEIDVRIRMAHIVGHSCLIDSPDSRGGPVEAPLLNRAWVFQERLLATRTLHFGASELMWECNSSLACECTGILNTVATDHLTHSNTSGSEIGLKRRFADICQHRASKRDTLDTWLDIVEAYSALALTNETDRPYAIAGIALRLAGGLQCGYFAGILAADLPRALLWCGTSIEANSGMRLLPSAPTWSWMSVCLPDSDPGSGRGYYVRYQEEVVKDLVQDRRLHIDFSETGCEHSDTNSFGPVSSVRMKITGAIWQGKIGVNHVGDDAGYTIAIGPPFRCFQVYMDCPIADGVRDGQNLSCLLVGADSFFHYFLLLKPRGGSKMYSRVGLASFRTDTSHFGGSHNLFRSLLDRLRVRQVTIV